MLFLSEINIFISVKLHFKEIYLTEKDSFFSVDIEEKTGARIKFASIMECQCVQHL